jgi:hypothetical protein
MKTVLRYLAQAVLYGAFFAFVGYFSTSPRFEHLRPDEALIRISFSHAAQRVGECRERSDEELAKLAPNMRLRTVCPRERAPVLLEIDMDGKPLYKLTAQPTGLQKDGQSTVYRRLTVKSGQRHFVARLSDHSSGVVGYTKEFSIDLAPGKVMVLDFNAAQGGFIIHQG